MNVEEVISARWGDDERTHFVITVITKAGRKCDVPCRWDSENPVLRDMALRAQGGEYGEIGQPQQAESNLHGKMIYDSILGTWVRRDPITGLWRDRDGTIIKAINRPSS